MVKFVFCCVGDFRGDEKGPEAIGDVVTACARVALFERIELGVALVFCNDLCKSLGRIGLIQLNGKSALYSAG